MNASSLYEAQVKKLNGICDEHELVFRLYKDTYPITLKIQPNNTFDAQLSMLEAADEDGMTSMDASITFFYDDDGIRFRYSGTRLFITDTLQSKIKNIFKKICEFWLKHFFWDVIVNAKLSGPNMPSINDEASNTMPPTAETFEVYEDDEDEGS